MSILNVIALWLAENWVTKALLAVLVIDVLLGTLRAAGEHALNSSVSRRGMYRKVGIVLLVALGEMFEREVGLPLSELIAGFFAKAEAESVVENMTLLGLPVPPALTQFFHLLPPYDKQPEVSQKTIRKLTAEDKLGVEV